MVVEMVASHPTRVVGGPVGFIRLALCLLVAAAANNTCDGGLGLIQKSPRVRKIDAEAPIDAWLPVDGGVNRACRGASASDNKAEYFTVLSAPDLEGCKALCGSCSGIEFHTSGRCEVWSRRIEASINLGGYTCLSTEAPADDFLEVDGGSNRACRGANQADNDPAHYTVSTGLSQEQCKEACRDNVACKGIEHAGTRCEVWTRGIDASVASSGSTCLKLEFSSVAGPDHACRGANVNDNQPTYFEVVEPLTSEGCKERCRMTSGCVGVEFIGSRCEIWTRAEGIQAAKAATGYTCLRYHGGLAPPPSTKQERDARFLIQASFGPTRASLAELSNQTYDAWIDQQMALPVSSLRAYYRTRVNPRPVRKSSDMDSGSPRSRCAAGSRWVNHVILKTDAYRKIKVRNNKIYVDDFFRSEVDVAYLGNGLRAPQSCSNVVPVSWEDEGRTCTSRTDLVERECTKDSVWVEDQYCKQTCFDLGLGYESDDCSSGWVGLDYEGYICEVDGVVGGWLQLRETSSCGGAKKAMLNPAVWKSNPDSSITQPLSVELFRPGVLLLKEPPTQCNLGTIIRSDIEEAGQFYMLEERLELVENTLENPAASGVTGGKCPTVARTFLNEHSCRLLPGCLPLGQEKLAVELTTANLAKFFTVGGRYVYETSGLRTTTSPCNQASRWKRCTDCSPSSLDMMEAEKIQTALAAEQGAFRNIDVSCSNVPAESIVQVGDVYFQHVHLDEGSVFDFTDWVLQHPGGPEKIKQFTSLGYKLIFPSWHPMDRWDSGLGFEVISPNFVGKMGSTVLFHNLPQPLQTESIATALGASTQTPEFSQVCGSPGEVPNNPAMGHQLSFKHGAPSDDRHFDSEYHFWWDRDDRSKSAVWTMMALYAPDQLRHRMAWALSQIYVCSKNGAGYEDRTESWLAYYDIFVRHAFGNLRDVIREVTYNPIMGDYLTYRKNRKKDDTGRFPDENYAREIMQLFTIGLWKLNPDGTRMLDANGQAIPTYSNDNIMDFARVFTGFDDQSDRGNVEYVDFGKNQIDPMQMKEDWHDRYPKPDLNGGYLGDAYPLCSDLPERSFLEKGARYTFLGKDVNGYLQGEGALNLTSGSALYQALCFTSNGRCAYNLTVVLPETLQCSGKECDTVTLKKVTVDGGLYEYLEPMCVNLFFFNGQVTRQGGRKYFWSTSPKCRDPNALTAGVQCCGGCTNEPNSWMVGKNYTCYNWPGLWERKCNQGTGWWLEDKFCQLTCWQKGVGYEGDDCSLGLWEGSRPCNYQEERVRLSTAEQACKAKGMQLCHERLEGYGCGYDGMEVWTQETCSYEVLVYGDGMVSSNWTSTTRQNRFKVNWKDNNFPSVQSGCAGCQVSGDICSCSMTESLRLVFTEMPTVAQVVTLKLGAHTPSTPCSVNCAGDVKAYLKDGKYDEHAVFEYQGKFYSNKESVVLAGGSEFRNPPVFMDNSAESETRQALAEVESLIDHLFEHPNTAPFISYRLIQRLVTSNPSPGYVKDVADAFRSGKHNGKTFSGRYGDLAATTAAILLHREARFPSSSSDGALREPLLKFIHIMRSLEYKDHQNRMVILRDLQERIAQFPFHHPSVFSYFQPDFKPDRFAEQHVGPEFQILTQPMIISFVNGVSSLIDHGLSNCDNGFSYEEPHCSYGVLQLGEQDCIQPSLDELDLLLTGGRLHNKALLRAAYDEAAGADRYKVAQKAVILSPEFNVMGNIMPMGPRATSPPQVLAEPQDYKALIMVYLNGGVDSFNMLVPTDCPLYDEYHSVRQNVALDAAELLKITATGQPCASFGIHPELDVFKELYDNQELAFTANVGSLVEPLDKKSYEEGSGARCVNLFSHSDQIRAAHTLTCQRSTAAFKGAGGRLADAMAAGSQKLRTMSFSLVGNQEWPRGMETIPEILSSSGPVGIHSLEQLQVIINNITSIQHGNIYAEEYNQLVAEAVAFNAVIQKSLRSANLQTSFVTDGKDLTKQLKEVSRLISTRAQRKVDRDIFFVQLGGFDNHRSLSSELAESLDDVNHAVKRFVAEMKAQNIFDKVVMATHSDFARTLTPNSNHGTDHGWAGNYMVVGGGVKGGQILNSFPSSLLPGADQDAGRGRLIPKYPFESFMLPVAEWMGMEAGQASQVFPNIGNFNSSALIDRSRLFK